MVNFEPGYNFPSIDRVQDARITLTEEERNFVRNNPAKVGTKALQLAGVELYTKLPPASEMSLKEVYDAFGAMRNEVSADSHEVNASRQVEQGLEDAINYREAKALIERLDDKYGPGVLDELTGRKEEA